MSKKRKKRVKKPDIPFYTAVGIDLSVDKEVHVAYSEEVDEAYRLNGMGFQTTFLIPNFKFIRWLYK